jgi:hypothetical protein
MATIAYALDPSTHGGSQVVHWDTLTTTNTVGEAVAFTEFADRTVQVFGTFGAGGTVTIQGSNDGGTTWAALHEVDGTTALTFTSAGIRAILEVPALIRPGAVAGDGTTSINVYIQMRGRER